MFHCVTLMLELVWADYFMRRFKQISWSGWTRMKWCGKAVEDEPPMNGCGWDQLMDERMCARLTTPAISHT